MMKNIFTVFFLLLAIFPITGQAESNNSVELQFKARVEKVLLEKNIERGFAQARRPFALRLLEFDLNLAVLDRNLAHQ